MDDNNYSSNQRSMRPDNIVSGYTPKGIGLKSDYFSGVTHSVGLFDRDEVDLVNKRYRFGVYTPSDTIHTLKEYLFFTKPDLNIYPLNPYGNKNGQFRLNKGLQNETYWMELLDKNPEVFYCLQDTLSKNKDHFNHLLENTCKGNLSIPGLTSEMVETPSNLYGINFQYHGTGEASDDSFDFSLEFKDVKGLPVYNFFRAYEDYERLKHHGSLETNIDYIINKILYDNYSIFKFLVDEDGETIIYYAQLYGVTSKSLPRDVFENTTFGDGLSYTIDFHAAFFEDMRPNIIKNFNMLSKDFYNSRKYQVDIYNDTLDRTDGRAAQAAYIVTDATTKQYKLKWRGDDRY